MVVYFIKYPIFYYIIASLTKCGIIFSSLLKGPHFLLINNIIQTTPDKNNNCATRKRYCTSMSDGHYIFYDDHYSLKNSFLSFI